MNSDDVEVRAERTAAPDRADGTQAGDFPAGAAYRGERPAASTYRTALPGIALLGGACAFGSCGLSVALLGLGVPFLAAALAASFCAGLLIYALGRLALARASKR